MLHIVNWTSSTHCLLAHPPMSFIILIRHEQSLMLIIYTCQFQLIMIRLYIYIYYSLSIFALNFVSMHFLCIFFLSSVHALTQFPFRTASRQHKRNEIYMHLSDSNVYIYMLYVYTVCMYIYYMCMYILCVCIYCIYSVYVYTVYMVCIYYIWYTYTVYNVYVYTLYVDVLHIYCMYILCIYCMYTVCIYCMYVYTVCIYCMYVYILYVCILCMYVYILYGAGTKHKTHLLSLEESTNQNPTVYYNQQAQKIATIIYIRGFLKYGHFQLHTSHNIPSKLYT